MTMYESRIIFPDGRPFDCGGQFPSGWRPDTKDSYEFWRKRGMLKHTTESGFTYEFRAVVLFPVVVAA